MKTVITKESVTQYELLNPLLSGIYHEFRESAKKKPDTPLNNFKVKSVNRVAHHLGNTVYIFFRSYYHYLITYVEVVVSRCKDIDSLTGNACDIHAIDT